jgi:4-hydroxy-2-oxoheptanedioate aldolase
MPINRVKQKLEAGRPVSVVAPIATSAGLVELLGGFGFDGVFLDGEHGPAGWEDVEHMARAAQLAGYTAIMRVQSNDAATITRALDRGVGGVQVPHVNTPEEAQAAVRHAKFAPLGERGWSTWRAAYGEDPAEFARQANEQTMVVAMLEETQALHRLDEIVRVEQVDVLFVAPGDLAQSMGLPGQADHPRVTAAVEDAVRRIHAAGRVAGVLTTPAAVERHLEMGARFLWVSLPALLGPAAREFVGRIEAG